MGPDRRTDGQADMTKLIVAFANCANASKNEVTRTINTPRLANVLILLASCQHIYHCCV